MKVIAAVLLLAFPGFTFADSLVLGRVLTSYFLEDAGSACVEDDAENKGSNELESICMYGWAHWIIEVDRTIGGKKVRGRVHAARAQHTEMLRDYQKRLRLFALSPIEDAGLRKKLRADFFLLDMSQEMFCMSQDPQVFGLPEAYLESGSGDDKEFCFDLRPKDDR